MGIFGQLFAKNESAQTTNAPADSIPNAPISHAPILNAPSPTTEQDLIERFIGIALDKQTDLYDVIGDNNWAANLDIAQLSFAEDKKFSIQTLGTYSHQSNSWLSAWANKQTDWPENVRVQSHQLKLYGEQNNVDIFSHGSFGAPISDVHLIGQLASGLFASSAYYIADYGDGAMLFLLNAGQLPAAKNEHARVITMIPQMISAYEMNHKNAILHYLTAKSYSISQKKIH